LPTRSPPSPKAGRDELILFPCNPDTAQVALVAQAAGL
jgi:hypothetical protein